jgi:hypothetical protein
MTIFDRSLKLIIRYRQFLDIIHLKFYKKTLPPPHYIPQHKNVFHFWIIWLIRQKGKIEPGKKVFDFMHIWCLFMWIKLNQFIVEVGNCCCHIDKQFQHSAKGEENYMEYLIQYLITRHILLHFHLWSASHGVPSFHEGKSTIWNENLMMKSLDSGGCCHVHWLRLFLLRLVFGAWEALHWILLYSKLN